MTIPEEPKTRTVWEILEQSGFQMPLTLSQIFAEIELATSEFKARVNGDEAVALEENLDKFRKGQS